MVGSSMVIVPAARHSVRCLCAVLLFVFPHISDSRAQAQNETPEAGETPAQSFGSGAGGIVLLTNNGFGLGGYARSALGEKTSFLLEGHLVSGKDDRELRFQSLDSAIIPNKRNYFLMLPLHIGVQRRLFAEAIEDNFRPYIHLTAGPSFGWEYPYFEDRNGNDIFDDAIDRRYNFFSAFPRGSFRLGVGGSIALGAYFGTRSQIAQGVRVGYSFHYFFDGIQLLEPDIRKPQSLFQSPVITIIFGRIL